MDDFRKELEVFKAKLDLDVATKLRTSDDRLDQKVRVLETKVHTLQQLAALLGTLAVVFGVTGAWGYSSLMAARDKLTTLRTEVDSVSKVIVDWPALKESYATDLRNIGQQQLAALQTSGQETSKTAMQTLETEVRRQASSLLPVQVQAEIRKQAGDVVQQQVQAEVQKQTRDLTFEQLKVRNLKVIGSQGETRLLLTTSDADNGLFEIYNSAGKVLLRGDASGTGGTWFAYNSESEKLISSIGASTTGDGGLWLFNSAGKQLLSGNATGAGGNWYSFSAETEKKITSVGASPSGDGGVWLFSVAGKQLSNGGVASAGRN